MKVKTDYLGSTTPLATATGVGSIGAAMFGAPGAVVGVIIGLGFGFWIESQKEQNQDKTNRRHKTHA